MPRLSLLFTARRLRLKTGPSRFPLAGLKSAYLAGATSTPRTSSPTLGTVVGLTVLVDFPITNRYGTVTNTMAGVVGSGITLADIEEYLNGENFTKYGNASSVRKYFEDVSCGRMSYTNILLRGPHDGYFMARYPREYYADHTKFGLHEYTAPN